MPLVKTLRSRGATVTVVANGELLFTPTGSIARWNRSLSNKIRGAAAQEAPTNKRPRWGHYGKPLKSTMRATTDIDAVTMMAHAAVGSVSPHGYYVDQGTGVYAGGSPYPAKILPPWKAKGYRFYEHTWRPGGGKSTMAPVLIKGQKGQQFLDAGLKRGFRAMRIPQGAANPAMIGKALGMFPEGLENFFGNTPADAAFVAQLTEWRAERDAAWQSEREARTRAADERYAAKKARQAATRDAILGELSAVGRATAAAKLKALQAAADRRAEEQLAKIKAQQDRKAAGEERRRKAEERKEEATKERIRVRKFEAARLEAYKYMHAIEGVYPDAQVQISKNRTVIRVNYTGPDGTKINEYFLR